jgi:hypothetical protein
LIREKDGYSEREQHKNISHFLKTLLEQLNSKAKTYVLKTGSEAHKDVHQNIIKEVSIPLIIVGRTRSKRQLETAF